MNKHTLLGLILAMMGSWAASASEMTLYDDALGQGVDDWSWATRNLSNTHPVAKGRHSMYMEPDAWGGVSFRLQQPVKRGQYNHLAFQIHGGDSAWQKMRVYLEHQGNKVGGDHRFTVTKKGGWTQVSLNLEKQLNLANSSDAFDRVVIQADTSSDQAPVFLDDIKLQNVATSEVGVYVDFDRNKRAINPHIYGVNRADDHDQTGRLDQLKALKFPARRWGGTDRSRYNWKSDATHQANDWYFLAVPREGEKDARLPDGSSADVFMSQSLINQSEPLMTLPTIGWVAKGGGKKWPSFSVAKYGEQTETECSRANAPPGCHADAGNGRCDPSKNTTGFCDHQTKQIVGNDPFDASAQVGPDFIAAWVAHVNKRAGTAKKEGVRFWALDNEPMLWHKGHRDVHPQLIGYDELWASTVAYGGAVKRQDPDAQIFGPVSWGWCSYFGSAKDQEEGQCKGGSDRRNHGNKELIPWYLEQVCHYKKKHGVRLVDYLDIHFYPEGKDKGSNAEHRDLAGLWGDEGDGSERTVERRLNAIKELYDWNHVSESWVDEKMVVIPRMKNWINQHCPGTKLAITEYKFGPDNSWSGALAQAELLSLFAREGVDFATRWQVPKVGSRTEEAFRMYLSYDGKGSQLTGDSTAAYSKNPDSLASYAGSNGKEGHHWVVLINKTKAPIEAVVDFNFMLEGKLRVYQFAKDQDNGKLKKINERSTYGRIRETVPAYSATLLSVKNH